LISSKLPNELNVRPPQANVEGREKKRACLFSRSFFRLRDALFGETVGRKGEGGEKDCIASKRPILALAATEKEE